MRRALALAVALAALAALPAVAGAHPLGNFSVNHLTEVKVSTGRIDVRYILDQAEIPTFQERAKTHAEIVRSKQAEVARELSVTVDGHALALRSAGSPRLSFPLGAGGLHTTRLVLALAARTPSSHRVTVHDGTFRGRIGWRAVVPQAGRGTAVRSSAPGDDPTRGLTRYPTRLLASPADVRTAHLAVRPGAGTLDAPGAPRLKPQGGGADGFAALFADAAAGRGVLVLLLLAAFGWGAVHALSPGHGKAMVAAYLVGTRGTARHAAALGLTVTVTHTIGVLALGVVALVLSHYVLPEQLYPWLNLVSGLLVVGVGLAVLRSRIRRRAHQHHHHHHDHDHAHHHHPTAESLRPRALLAMGASAGLIPCPSALVVLLSAVAQHQIALGLLLIVAFSAGLAMTLTALGVAVVGASRAAPRLPVPGTAVAALPTLSALAIVTVGLVLTAQAVGTVA
jgi:nickel/cobalt exporter